MKTPRSLAFVMLAVIPLVAVPAAQADPAAAGPAQEPAVVAAPAEITAEGAGYADTIMRRINELRAQQGLKPLTRYTQLDSVAQGWSEQMAAQKSMTHNPTFADQYPAGWTSASENVAVLGDSDGSNVGDQLFVLWRDSSNHYANMVAPDVNAVGIGVAYDAETGAWYATQDFAVYPDPAAVGLTPTGGAASPAPSTPSAQPGGESAAPTPTAANDGAAEPSAAPADPGAGEQPPQADPAAPSEEAAPAEPGAEEDPAGAADAGAPAGDSDPGVPAAATAAAVSQPARLTLPVPGASLIGGVVALIAIVAGLVLLLLRRRRR